MRTASNSQFRKIVDQAKAVDLEELLRRYAVTLSRGAGWISGPCPVCGGTDRFAVNLRKQIWNCRGCGVGGDAINLACHVEGLTFAQAVRSLVDGGEVDPSPERRVRKEHRAREAEEYEQRQRVKARGMWRSSRPATGSLAEIYLRSRRRIGVPIPSTVRFLPPRKPEHHPAMLASYGMPDEPEPGILRIAETVVSAVHLTLLKPDGSDKAAVEKPKITVASPGGQPIVLAPPNDLLGLAVTEGIEDGLTVHQATGLGVWAAGSGGYMPSLAGAVPDWIECVTIFAHEDETGRTGANGLAEALLRRGFEVRVEGLS